ncbi:MAG: ribonuclease P protein component [Patescibacteria group bacterium]
MASFKYNGLILKVGERLPEGSMRLKVVVSKKVAKQAVRRNRIRRILKEAARKEFECAERMQDIVLIVLPGFEAANVKEAREILHRLFRKASLSH